MHTELPRRTRDREITAPGLLLAVDEHTIAGATGLTVAWLRKDRAGKRLIPFLRVGRCIRYSPEAVQRALATRQEGGAA